LPKHSHQTTPPPLKLGRVTLISSTRLRPLLLYNKLFQFFPPVPRRQASSPPSQIFPPLWCRFVNSLIFTLVTLYVNVPFPSVHLVGWSAFVFSKTPFKTPTPGDLSKCPVKDPRHHPQPPPFFFVLVCGGLFFFFFSGFWFFWCGCELCNYTASPPPPEGHLGAGVVLFSCHPLSPKLSLTSV